VKKSPLQIHLYLKMGLQSTSNKRIVLNWKSTLPSLGNGNDKYILEDKISVHWFAVVYILNILQMIMQASYSNISHQWVSSNFNTLQTNGRYLCLVFSLTRPQNWHKYRNVCPSVCLQIITREPLKGFSRKLILWSFSQQCWHIQILVKNEHK
jgi:hypothetical protein